MFSPRGCVGGFGLRTAGGVVSSSRGVTNNSSSLGADWGGVFGGVFADLKGGAGILAGLLVQSIAEKIYQSTEWKTKI